MDSRMELTAVVLAEIEACSFRNKTIAETAAHMKPLLDKYLPLGSSTSGSTTLQAERQKDHYSHFILRLAFASTEDLRRRFSRVESTLFRIRFQADNLKERQQFVEGLNLDWETVIPLQTEDVPMRQENSAANARQGLRSHPRSDEKQRRFVESKSDAGRANV